MIDNIGDVFSSFLSMCCFVNQCLFLV